MYGGNIRLQPTFTIDGFDIIEDDVKYLKKTVRKLPVTAHVSSSILVKTRDQANHIIRYADVDENRKLDHVVLIVGTGREMNPTQAFIPISIQQIVDCYDMYKNELAEGGRPKRSFRYIAYTNQGRVYGEADYPIRDGNYIRKGECATETLQPTFTIDGFDIIEDDEEYFKKTVRKLPVTAHVSSSILVKTRDQVNHIIRYADVDENRKLDHVVLIVGYVTRDGVDYSKILNSLGPNVGTNGCFYLERSTDDPSGTAGIARQCCYPLKQGFN
ncbi:putative zingipain [Helianthus anomalus]